MIMVINPARPNTASPRCATRPGSTETVGLSVSDEVWCAIEPTLAAALHTASGLWFDDSDIRHVIERCVEKLCDLLDSAHQAAIANGREAITLSDLPLTEGFQESMWEAEKATALQGSDVVFDLLVGGLSLLPLDDLSREALPSILATLVHTVAKVVGVLTAARSDPRTPRCCFEPTVASIEQALRLLDLTL
jgi:hypothetical protein